MSVMVLQGHKSTPPKSRPLESGCVDSYVAINTFTLRSICMEVSASLSCLFVHEPPYQTTVVCCNPVFHRGSLDMDHHITFNVI